jgi:hypothetical protein
MQLGDQAVDQGVAREAARALPDWQIVADLLAHPRQVRSVEAPLDSVEEASPSVRGGVEPGEAVLYLGPPLPHGPTRRRIEIGK